MRILVLNGPTINMLGVREPAIYGEETYDDLCAKIQSHCAKIGADVEIFQSNHEGDLVDKILNAYGKADGIIINAAAYTHTSIALLDALRAVNIPAVEVHISDINRREDFRRISYVSAACFDSVTGEGTNGYLKAIDILVGELKGE